MIFFLRSSLSWAKLGAISRRQSTEPSGFLGIVTPTESSLIGRQNVAVEIQSSALAARDHECSDLAGQISIVCLIQRPSCIDIAVPGFPDGGVRTRGRKIRSDGIGIFDNIPDPLLDFWKIQMLYLLKQILLLQLRLTGSKTPEGKGGLGGIYAVFLRFLNFFACSYHRIQAKNRGFRRIGKKIQ